MLFSHSKSSQLFSQSALPKVDVPCDLPTDRSALASLLLDTQKTVVDLAEKAHQEAIATLELEVKNIIQQQVQQQVQEKLQYFIEQIKLARQRQFGSSSELIPGQGRLFDEAEVLAALTTDEDDIAPTPEASFRQTQPKSSTPRGKRTPLPLELERVDIIHEIPLADRTTPEGIPMVEIGEEISEQLDILPMKVRVLRHIRKRYGIPGGLSAPVLAPLPPQPLPKSNASPDFLAMLYTTKYVDGLPLARFEKV
jgi:transposase